MPFCRDNDRVFVTRSIDDGRTWSNPVEVTQSVKPSSWTWYATGPGVGIQLKHGEHAGRLVIPCDHGTEQNGQRTMTSHVFYSDDHGMTWQLGGSLDRHTDECQLVELSDATLLINCRNYWERDGGRPDRGRMRAVAHSHDGGQTWSELRFDETLIEPMCQASLVSNPENHDQLLFSNPASTDSRDHLTVRLSRDAGKSWPVSLLLHEGPAAYSSLAVLPNGLAACLYEAGQQSAYEAIRFAPFRVEWLAK
jgi:sialidase-1